MQGEHQSFPPHQQPLLFILKRISAATLKTPIITNDNMLLLNQSVHFENIAAMIVTHHHEQNLRKILNSVS